MQKQKNGHTGLLPNVTVIPFFPLEDVWIMVFELSLIRFAFSGGFCFFSVRSFAGIRKKKRRFTVPGRSVQICVIYAMNTRVPCIAQLQNRYACNTIAPRGVL